MDRAGTGTTAYAILPALQGKAVNLLGSIDQLHTFTDVADFGKLLAALGTHDEALGEVWFAPSNAPTTQAQFVQMVEEQLGSSVKMRVGSRLILQTMGLFNREIKELVEMNFLWTGPYIIDSSKAERAFGLRPTPMHEAVKETVTWCRAYIQKK